MLEGGFRLAHFYRAPKRARYSPDVMKSFFYKEGRGGRA